MTDIDSNSTRVSALVDPQWLAAHRDDADVCLVEIAGLGQGRRVGVPGGPDVGAERYDRIPGALHLHCLPTYEIAPPGPRSIVDPHTVETLPIES